MFKDNSSARSRNNDATNYIERYGRLPTEIIAHGSKFQYVIPPLTFVSRTVDYCPYCYNVNAKKVEEKTTFRSDKFRYQIFQCYHCTYYRIPFDIDKLLAIRESTKKIIDKSTLKTFLEKLSLEELPINIEQFESIINELNSDESPVIKKEIVEPLITTIDTIIKIEQNRHPLEMLKNEPGKKNIALEFLTIAALAKQSELTVKQVRDALSKFNTKYLRVDVINKFIQDRNCSDFSNTINKKTIMNKRRNNRR